MEKNIVGLAHIGLYVRDIEVSKKFYTTLLGFEVACETKLGNGLRLCFLKNGSCEIELVEKPAEERTDGHFDHVALRVNDIEQAVKALQAAGIQTEFGIHELPTVYNGIKNAMFRGPDHEHIEFNEFK